MLSVNQTYAKQPISVKTLVHSFQGGLTSQISACLLESVEHNTREDWQPPVPAVTDIRPLRHHLHQILLFTLSDGTSYVFKRPAIGTRYLRHEKIGLQVEAHVLTLLANEQSNMIFPRLLKLHFSNTLYEMPYLITSYLSGNNMATTSLSIKEQRIVDYSVGRNLWHLSRKLAVTFGDPIKVRDGRGYSTWREAFTWLMESVLRDAEDLLVSLPFHIIRSLFVSRGECLNDVTQPRLTALLVGKRDILVNEQCLKAPSMLGWGGTIYGDPWAAEMLVCSPSEGLLKGFLCPQVTDSRADTRRLL